jgi:hypothetical protein
VTRPCQLLVLGALLAVAPFTGSALAGLQDDGGIVLKLGDRARVEGQPLGCQVVRRGGEVVVDCRKSGHLRGTYGVFMGKRTVKVAHYRSDRVAKVVFTARQRGKSRTCDDGRR